ncbi:MAG: amino acid ABC transporter substrate-binding protein [Succinivibrio sp.]|nr:amino acid ABC transporter substrate-binding protein [Succinivibrio sp.]
MGIEYNYPPYQFHDKSGEIVGFEIDLMNAIAREMEVSFEYQEGPYNVIYARTQNGELDALLGGNVITSDRHKDFLVSDRILSSGWCMAVHEIYDGMAAEDLESMKSKQICVEKNTVGHRYTRSMRFQRITDFENVPQMIEAFNDGQCVSMIADCLNFEHYLKDGTIQNAVLIPEPLLKTQVGVLVAGNEPQLRDLVNTGLEKCREDGTYDQIYRKWFGSSAIGHPLEK